MIVSGIPESEALASAVWALAANESRLCQIALMWLAVNQRRVSGGQASLVDICRQMRESGLGRCANSPQTNDVEAYRRMVEMARSVLLGEAMDPTFGAWKMHLHSESPDWSQDLAPTALIGPYFFYAPGIQDAPVGCRRS